MVLGIFITGSILLYLIIDRVCTCIEETRKENNTND